MKLGFYFKNLQQETNGGGFTYQHELLNALINCNTQHKIVIYYSNKENLFENKNNVNFVNLYYEKQTLTKKKFFWHKKMDTNSILNEILIRDNIELLYFIPISYEKVSVPYVFMLWDLDHKQTPYFPEVSVTGWKFDNRENFYSFAIPKASYIVIGNNEGKRQLCRNYNINEDLIITNPMPTPNYIYNLTEDNSILSKYKLITNQYLLYPAQFWPHKNHIRLVKAIKKLKEQGCSFKMVFTGSDQGNEKYIKEKVQEYELENDVLFLGFVTREELITLYKNAYALTFASYMGPDNIPPLEAMGLGCPVISSNTKGMQEQLQDCALFFNPKDENSLIEQIKILENQTVRQNLINKGFELAKKYNIDDYVKNLLNITDEFAPIRECWSNKEPYIHL